MNNNENRITFKTTFLTGVFVTFPLALTVIAVIWLFELLDGILGHMLSQLLGDYYITGLGLILSVLGIYGIGAVARTVFGKQVIGYTEKVIMRLPVFKSFYATFKQLGDAFSPDNRASFKKFVVVEYPRPGAHSFGFLTKECVIKTESGEQCYNAVYIPTNHLYLGDICLFKREEVMVTDLSIEDGIKVVISAGIASPNVISTRANGDWDDEEAPPIEKQSA